MRKLEPNVNLFSQLQQQTTAHKDPYNVCVFPTKAGDTRRQVTQKLLNKHDHFVMGVEMVEIARVLTSTPGKLLVKVKIHRK